MLTGIINEATGLKLKKSMNTHTKEDQATIQDKILTSMVKNIAEKFNQQDLKSIEQSKGDITKYKHYDSVSRCIGFMNQLADSRNQVSKNSKITPEFATAAREYRMVLQNLVNNKERYAYHIAKGDVFTTLYYTGAVAALTYGVSYIICETMEFHDLPDGGRELVVIDNKKVLNNVHSRAIRSMYKFIDDGSLDKLYREADRRGKESAGDIAKSEMNVVHNNTAGMNESFTFAGGISLAAVGGVSLLIIGLIVTPILIWRIIPAVREVLYTIYNLRVRIDEGIEVQKALLDTNIQSLEYRKADKKIIARQKAVVDALEKIRTVFAIKCDDAETKALQEIRSENRDMGISDGSFDMTNNGLLI